MLGYFGIFRALLQTLILYIVFGLLLGRGDILFALHILIGMWYGNGLSRPCVSLLSELKSLRDSQCDKITFIVYPSVILLSQL